MQKAKDMSSRILRSFYSISVLTCTRGKDVEMLALIFETQNNKIGKQDFFPIVSKN